MRILFCTLYYLPHRTGMQLYIQRLAEALAARGHAVTILACRHRPDLALEEELNGVRIVRLPTLSARISRGRLMPGFPKAFSRLAAGHDVVSVHSPMLESGLISRLARRSGIVSIPTHHGDVVLPKSLVNRVIGGVMHASFDALARTAPAVVAYSRDYAEHSHYLRPYADKVTAIAPPVVMPLPDAARAAELRREWANGEGPLIAYAGRVVEEKRPDLLLKALDVVAETFPHARVVFAGEHQIGYERTWERMGPLVERHRSRLIFLGMLDDMQLMANYYAACDVLALPSDTECFGLVQVEAMLCGTPVVMSDAPGGRVPVQATGMGRIFPRGDWRALGSAIVDVATAPERYRKPREAIAETFSFKATVDAYEELFRRHARR